MLFLLNISCEIFNHVISIDNWTNHIFLTSLILNITITLLHIIEYQLHVHYMQYTLKLTSVDSVQFYPALPCCKEIKDHKIVAFAASVERQNFMK